MHSLKSQYQLTLADVCEAIAQGRLATSVDCGGWYRIRERDIAMLLGSAMPKTRRIYRPCHSPSSCLN